MRQLHDASWTGKLLDHRRVIHRASLRPRHFLRTLLPPRRDLAILLERQTDERR